MRRSYDPDLVVSVHPLMQHINCQVLRERAKRLGRARPTPFATVVTDFTTCHNTWFCKVRSPACMQTAMLACYVCNGVVLESWNVRVL